MISLALGIICSYLLGSIPFGYIIVRWVKRIDLRSIGSGNIGATNAVRAAGKKVGLIVFLLDLCKGLLAVLGVAVVFIDEPSLSQRMLCGFAAILGHNFPVFLRLSGGKGVASSVGVILGTMPAVALGCLLTWAAFFYVWRYVSLASLVAAAMIPVLQVFLGQSIGPICMGAMIALLIVVRHQANIRRLMHGQELRFGSK